MCCQNDHRHELRLARVYYPVAGCLLSLCCKSCHYHQGTKSFQRIRLDQKEHKNNCRRGGYVAQLLVDDQHFLLSFSQLVCTFSSCELYIKENCKYSGCNQIDFFQWLGKKLMQMTY